MGNPLSSKSIDYDGIAFVLTFPFDRDLREILKQTVPGCHWTGEHWEAPVAARGQIARFAARQGFVPTNAAMARFEEDAERPGTSARVASSYARDSELVIEGLGLPLHGFQKAGVAYALDNIRPNAGIVFGDEMGLGKSPESLATLQMLKAFPAFVTCPSNVWLKWAKEVNKWLPGRKTCLLSGASVSPRLRNKAAQHNAVVCLVGEPLPEADVYVVAHANFIKWVKPRFKTVGGERGGKQRKVVSGATTKLRALKLQAFVYDEAHAFKEDKALRTQAAQALATLPIPYRIEASGTWSPNGRNKELLVNLGILGRLNDVAASEWEYLIRYCDGHNGVFGWEFDGSSNELELNRKMRGSFLVQRNKKDRVTEDGTLIEGVMNELPPLQLDFVDVDITNARVYNAVERELKVAKKEYAKALRILENSRDKPSITKWRTIAKAKGNEVGVLSNAAHKFVGEGKVKAVIEWLEQYLRDSDGKILVFGVHRDEVNIKIADHFKAPLIIGGVTAADRDDAEERFESDPACRILVAHVEAGGVGINMTAATDIAFAELPFRPMDFDQPIGRAYGRMNDIHGVNVYIFQAPDTIDDHIWTDIIAPKSEAIALTLVGAKA